MKKEIVAVGVPWYREEDYERLKEIFEDGHKLPATFDKWLFNAEKVIQTIKESGQIAVKAHIDPDDFVVWCRRNSLNIDSRGRMAFANAAAMARYRNVQ